MYVVYTKTLNNTYAKDDKIDTDKNVEVFNKFFEVFFMTNDNTMRFKIMSNNKHTIKVNTRPYRH